MGFWHWYSNNNREFGFEGISFHSPWFEFIETEIVKRDGSFVFTDTDTVNNSFQPVCSNLFSSLSSYPWFNVSLKCYWISLGNSLESMRMLKRLPRGCKCLFFIDSWLILQENAKCNSFFRCFKHSFPFPSSINWIACEHRQTTILHHRQKVVCRKIFLSFHSV